MSNTAAQVAFDRNQYELAIGNAARDYMNGLAPHLPSVFWVPTPTTRPLSTEINGYVDAVDHTDPAAVAEQWRDALGLDKMTESSGTRSYEGTVGKWYRISIWYITDKAAWDARQAELTAQYSPRNASES